MILKIGWESGGGVDEIAPGRVTWRITGSAVEFTERDGRCAAPLVTLLEGRESEGGGKKYRALNGDLADYGKRCGVYGTRWTSCCGY